MDIEGFKSDLLDAIDNYEKSNFRLALDVFIDALPTIERTAEPDQIIIFLEMISNCCLNLGEFDGAIFYFEKTMVLYVSLADKRGQANTLSKIGNSLHAVGKNGTEFLNRSTVIYRKLSDHAGIAANLTSTARILASDKDFDGAIEKYEEALQLFETLRDSISIVTTLSGMVDIYLVKDDLDQADETVELILKIGRNDDKFTMAIGLIEKGKVALRRKTENPPSEVLASEYFKSGIKYLEQLNMPFFTMEQTYKIGIEYVNFEFSQAYFYLRKSLDYAVKLDNTDYITKCNLAIDKIPNNIRELFR